MPTPISIPLFTLCPSHTAGLGKAVLEGHAIGVHLTVPTLKMICGAPVVWTDLQFKDYQM